MGKFQNNKPGVKTRIKWRNALVLNRTATLKDLEDYETKSKQETEKDLGSEYSENNSDS